MQADVSCPECGSLFVLSIPRLDQRVHCTTCWADLIVIRLNPPVLDWAFAEPLSRPEQTDLPGSHSLHIREDHD